MEPRTRGTSRHLVRSYGSYRDAERAVDYLTDDGFPVKELSIVAEDLRFVENVTGRRDSMKVAVGGATSGALIGASLGFALGLFSLVDPLISGLALAFWGALLGAAIGVVVAVLSHWITEGRHGFDSVHSMEAGRYDVVADTVDLAEQAACRLHARGRDGIAGVRLLAPSVLR